MGAIERQTLEKERESLIQAIELEKRSIAAGDSSLGDSDVPKSRREHLLELQSHLAVVQSRLVAVELAD